MTKEQAKEYATRIRLGEPVYWALGSLAAFLADGTQIAVADGRGKWYAERVSGVRRPWYPISGVRQPWYPMSRTNLTLGWVLEALDRVANAP
jgi:hypothetical protein